MTSESAGSAGNPTVNRAEAVGDEDRQREPCKATAAAIPCPVRGPVGQRLDAKGQQPGEQRESDAEDGKYSERLTGVEACRTAPWRRESRRTEQGSAASKTSPTVGCRDSPFGFSIARVAMLWEYAKRRVFVPASTMRYSSWMHLFVNGEKKSLSDGGTLSQLIERAWDEGRSSGS